jgi:hypothetical protein
MRRLDCTYCHSTLLYNYDYTSIKLCTNCGHVQDISGTKHQVTPYQQHDQRAEALLNKKINVSGKVFTLTGLICYHYTEGYMNLWSAYNGENYLWLGESLGVYFILGQTEQVNVKSLIPKIELEDTFTFKEKEFEIDAYSIVKGFSIWGELPYFPFQYSEFGSVECSNEQNILIINCYDREYQESFKGVIVEKEKLGL